MCECHLGSINVLRVGAWSEKCEYKLEDVTVIRECDSPQEEVKAIKRYVSCCRDVGRSVKRLR